MKLKAALPVIAVFILSLTGCSKAPVNIDLEGHAYAKGQTQTDGESTVSSIEDVREFNGEQVIEVNGNVPGFSDAEKASASSFHIVVSDEQNDGAYVKAVVGPDEITDITEEKEEDHGLVSDRLYPDMFGGDGSEYNQILLTKEASEAIKGYDDRIASYIKETVNHVLYRKSACQFESKDDLSGIQFESYSLEDDGEGISFNIFVHNV